jgi:hypothetical protein
MIMKIRDILGLIKIARKTKCDPTSKAYKKLESKVPTYILPDPLLCLNGKTVSDSTDWMRSRRPEIMELFKTHIYGHSPETPSNLRYRILESNDNALGGLALRRQLSINLSSSPDGRSMILLLYLPKKIIQTHAKVPVFLGLNFLGNHTIHIDPKIIITSSWIRPNPNYRKMDEEEKRGVRTERWQLEYVLKNGYGLATVYYGDIVPDIKTRSSLGVEQIFSQEQAQILRNGEWGAIGVWAWGLSRCMDYFEENENIDSSKIAILGHSRLGKTSLWAGAQDERFALVISNDSGCGGAAISRRHFGETVLMINKGFPHWFCKKFRTYNDKESLLPIDQHMLLGLIAPRPVYVASAQEDLWADPKGEFLSIYHAGVIYKLFNKSIFPTSVMPVVNEPIMLDLGYHMRTGGHNVTHFDWEQFIKFADMHLKN